MSKKDGRPNTARNGGVEGRGGYRPNTSWEKGQSGNPKGAPRRGLSWTEAVAEYAERPTPRQLQKYGRT